MAAIIAILLTFGIISAPEEATNELIQQYQQEIVILDSDVV
jgi:hypothetical protein